MQSTQVNDVEEAQPVNVEVQALFEAARKDMNLLAGLAMPHVFKFLFPPVFIAIWNWLLSEVDKEREFPKLAIGLPRGVSKTTVIKLFVLFCIIFTKKQYVLVIAASEAKAVNIITDVCNMLDNPTVQKVFGDWTTAIETNTKVLKVFWFRGRKIILHPAGAGTSIRGANVGDQRPDLVIFDDIQDREDSDSEQLSKALFDWFQGTALKTRSPFGCMYIFLGNMYPTKYSMLKWICEDPEWVKFVTGAILSDGTSIWEELFPIKQLMAEYRADESAGKKEIFLAEVMNDPKASANTSIDYSKLPMNPFEEETMHQGNFIIIDPSQGKSSSDDVSIGYCEIYDGLAVLKEVVAGKLSPGDTIKESLKLAFKHNCTLIIGEGNGYQETLMWWFNEVTSERGIYGITFMAEYSGQQSKNARILAWLKSWLAGECYVSDAARPQVLAQVIEWNPLRTNNTDGLLDLGVYSQRIAAKHAEFFAHQTYNNINNTANLRVVPATNNSPF